MTKMGYFNMLSPLLLVLLLGLHSCASKQSEKNKLLDLYAQILLLKPAKMPEVRANIHGWASERRMGRFTLKLVLESSCCGLVDFCLLSVLSV